jgi:predicted nucleotidyltransferase
MTEYDIIFALDMCMLDEIRAKRDEIYAIARRHKAEKLWVFGSCARREERPDSDVDLVASRILPQSLGFAHRVCKEAVPV